MPFGRQRDPDGGGGFDCQASSPEGWSTTCYLRTTSVCSCSKLIAEP